MTASFPVLPQNPEPRRIVEAVNNLLRGKMNVVTTVTLTAGATTTTLTDSRIGGDSHISLEPLTANAAAAHAALYVSAKTKGSATLTHASSANVDQTFSVLIIG